MARREGAGPPAGHLPSAKGTECRRSGHPCPQDPAPLSRRAHRAPAGVRGFVPLPRLGRAPGHLGAVYNQTTCMASCATPYGCVLIRHWTMPAWPAAVRHQPAQPPRPGRPTAPRPDATARCLHARVDIRPRKRPLRQAAAPDAPRGGGREVPRCLSVTKPPGWTASIPGGGQPPSVADTARPRGFSAPRHNESLSAAGVAAPVS